MKNIHLIPTDKPSRLCFRNYLFINKSNLTKYSNVEFKNLYITSDEEIKYDDYITDGFTLWIWRGIGDNISCKKIILTTDQDLIKDGVQAIPDEFLKWFVKSPSCEEVEIKPYCEKLTCKNDSCNVCCQELKYKITIPKEESKKETLEEARKRISNEFTNTSFEDRFKRDIQKLKLSKIPECEVEIEMEDYCQLLRTTDKLYCSKCQFENTKCKKLKLTNNIVNITKLIL